MLISTGLQDDSGVTELQDAGKIPELTVGQIVHSCGMEGFCVATIVAGVLSNFEEEGAIVAHVAFPAPSIPTVCHNNPLKYHKPVDKTDRPLRTWHLLSECVGGCKRMDAGSRLVH